MIKKAISLIVILILFAAGNVFAQNPRELNVGSNISGSINPGDEIWFSVRARSVGILTVETTGDTDTYLEAYDSQRNLIKEDDDSGEGFNAKIELIVSANTVYLFKLRAFDREASGPYRISAALGPMPQVTELRLGNIQNGRLNAGDSIWYSVRAARNTFLIVETTGNDIDTYLEAFDADYKLIASDDDSGEGYNAKIELIVTSNTVYYFKLRCYSSEETGPFTILATHRPLPTPTQLNIGASRSGNITRGSEHWYSVRPAQNCIIVVQTTSDIDTYLEAYDTEYNLITEDDDSGEDLNAKIEIFARAGVNYLFKLRGYDSNITGRFNITAAQKPLPTPARLNVGTTLSGNITEGGEYWYSITATRAGILVVETSGDTDTYMDAYNDSYVWLSSDDDSGEGLNARVSIYADANHTYFFKVRGYSEYETGAYRISVKME